MFKVLVSLAVVVAGVASMPSGGSHPSHGGGGYKQPGMPYNFAYGVKDDYAGTDFGQEENSDGNNVKGSYTVQLPDGRKQTVNYVADHYNGFVADVSYYGEAQYPHEYGPAITFKPSYSGGYQQPSYH